MTLNIQAGVEAGLKFGNYGILGSEPVTVTSQVDLPPTYNDIGQYQKVEDSNSKPPEYVEPPAYSS